MGSATRRAPPVGHDLDPPPSPAGGVPQELTIPCLRDIQRAIPVHHSSRWSLE